MKKRITIIAVVATLMCILGVRYYTINDGFAVHGLYPSEIYSMHETIEFENGKTYNMYEQPGYSISLESARIIDADAYLKELNANPENYTYLSEKYLELTLTISNNGDYQDGIIFYGLPVVGENWYTFYDEEITASINDFFVENGVSSATGCMVSKGGSSTVKIAYNLYKRHFLPDQWNNIINEKMWLWVTLMPEDRKIKIEID